MRYKIIIQPEAAFDLQRLAKSEPKAFAKANRFIQELAEHPEDPDDPNDPGISPTTWNWDW